MNRRKFLRNLFLGLASLPFIGRFSPKRKREWREIPVDAVNRKGVVYGRLYGPKTVFNDRDFIAIEVSTYPRGGRK